MRRLHKHLELVEKHCRDQGQRLTKKRKIVLIALLESQKALSAYEIIDRCKQDHSEVFSAMSVYRMLEFLQSQGLAHRLDSASKYVACSHIICDHNQEPLQFLICNQCQRVEEVKISRPAMRNLQAVIKKTGFHLRSPQLELSGVCDRCFSAQAHSG